MTWCMRFEIFRGETRYRLIAGRRMVWRRGRWYVRLRASNGRILCTSEGYTRHPACWKFIRAMRRCVDAPVMEPNGAIYGPGIKLGEIKRLEAPVE